MLEAKRKGKQDKRELTKMLFNRRQLLNNCCFATRMGIELYCPIIKKNIKLLNLIKAAL